MARYEYCIVELPYDGYSGWDSKGINGLAAKGWRVVAGGGAGGQGGGHGFERNWVVMEREV